MTATDTLPAPEISSGARAKRRVCLVTTSHISYNPRVVKEADALSDAGYDVRVVSLAREDDKWELDRVLMATRRWQLDPVDARPSSAIGKTRRVLSRIRSGSLSRLPEIAMGQVALERAYSRYFPELAAAARSKPADLYVAHNLPALPAAARAASHWNALLGFDAEDFHRGEITDEPSNAVLLRQTIAIEERYIPRCRYVTAASEGIAAAYEEALNLPAPTAILNVFPLAARARPDDPIALQGERPNEGISLYWYSQIIGPGRGLEVVVEALALLDSRFHLTLRGQWAQGYELRLMTAVQSLGIANRVRLLPTCPPNELIWRAALHDVGLAPEIPNTVNHRIAVSNKILSYLLAGVSVAASDVPGQRSLMAQVPDAGFVYEAANPASLAAGISALCASPDAMERSKRAAACAAEERFCWDLEAKLLVDVIDDALCAEVRQ